VSHFRRFPRWALKGVLDLLFKRLSGDRDFEYAMIDGTIVRVHQQGTGARVDSSSGDRTVYYSRSSWCADQRKGPFVGLSP
jgi:transposase